MDPVTLHRPVDPSWSIVVDKEAGASEVYLSSLRSFARNHCKVDLPVVSASPSAPTEEVIVFTVSPPSAYAASIARARGLPLPLPLPGGAGQEGHGVAMWARGAVVVGAEPDALRLACQTLIQALAQLQCALPGAATLVDWPSLPLRGVLLNGLGARSPETSFFERVDKMAALKMNFAGLELLGGIPFAPAQYQNLLLNITDYLTTQGIVSAPQINLGAPPPTEPRAAEGTWARGVPASVANNGLVTPGMAAILPLKDGDFEHNASGWARLPGSSPNTCGGVWQQDCQRRFSGNCAMHLACPSDLVPMTPRLLSNRVAVDGGRVYHVTLYYRTAGALGGLWWAWVVQTNSSGSEVRLRPVGIQLASSGGKWVEGTATFTTEAATAGLSVYLGGVNATGEVWVDTVLAVSLDHALLNVIRTPSTDIVVTSLDGAHTYTRGTDYNISSPTSIAGTVAGVSFRDPTDPMRLWFGGLGSNLTSVTIPDETAVHLSYDYQPGSMGHHTYGVYAGLSGHLPWPPSSSLEPGLLPPLTGPVGLSPGLQLGDVHNNINYGSGAACFAEPLYYQASQTALLQLLHFYNDSGRPLQ
eukprot:gene1280-421_t